MIYIHGFKLERHLLRLVLIPWPIACTWFHLNFNLTHYCERRCELKAYRFCLCNCHSYGYFINTFDISSAWYRRATLYPFLIVSVTARGLKAKLVQVHFGKLFRRGKKLSLFFDIFLNIIKSSLAKMKKCILFTLC